MKNIFAFILFLLTTYPSLVNANVSITQEKNSNGNTVLHLHFNGKDAKAISDQLDYAESMGGYVISDGAAGTMYTSSPGVVCKKINADALDGKTDKDSAHLYSCDMIIEDNGLLKTNN